MANIVSSFHKLSKVAQRCGKVTHIITSLGIFAHHMDETLAHCMVAIRCPAHKIIRIEAWTRVMVGWMDKLKPHMNASKGYPFPLRHIGV